MLGTESGSRLHHTCVLTAVRAIVRGCGGGMLWGRFASVWAASGLDLSPPRCPWLQALHPRRPPVEILMTKMAAGADGVSCGD